MTLRGGVQGMLLDAVRLYLARSPLPRGKRLIMRKLLIPMLPPPPATFVADVPGGGRVALRYREAIGLAHYVNGGFEWAELKLLASTLPSGAAVFDVGANVGYFTVSLALSVGPSGRVMACEPESENVLRLRENVAANGLTNVDIRELAVGGHDGDTTLYIGDDSVYHTTAAGRERLPITVAHETGRSVKVPVARLDTLWRETGSPDVAFIKIDVEGTEVSVLEGSRELIQRCRPSLLIETEDPRFEHVRTMLEEFGYVHTHPPDFFVSNHLFTPR
jgi:FkbM family methyltransferase